jgi:hypothetical protein
MLITNHSLLAALCERVKCCAIRVLRSCRFHWNIKQFRKFIFQESLSLFEELGEGSQIQRDIGNMVTAKIGLSISFLRTCHWLYFFLAIEPRTGEGQPFKGPPSMYFTTAKLHSRANIKKHQYEYPFNGMKNYQIEEPVRARTKAIVPQPTIA